ncbi:zinc dependent phospholipase C family protein [Paenibacillus doosanensis]|uniref:zinc dependent phospholipase C family protein n=1 Tax=Paenibacillus doosanensis TaxID=1229154 RepID=UPI00217FC8B6|nr:zinc dependent phospholipase C family protein [Paenibacillus doosanensis]MCS7462561.1 zinc dependent phospholipase C family protein [Paenibacillus doosanensis]
MPWPMIHFSIAFQMFGGHPPHDFFLGSIAPDAVQFREDKLSKAKSHLRDGMGSYPEWPGLIDFYDNRVQYDKDAGYTMFLLGYLSHIIADDLWGKYKRKISNQNKNVLQAIWNEENKYDFHLKRTVLWRDVIEQQVVGAALYELVDLYTLEELDTWRRKLFMWLKNPENEPSFDNQYLKDSNVRVFIDETADEIAYWMQSQLAISLRGRMDEDNQNHHFSVISNICFTCWLYRLRKFTNQRGPSSRSNKNRRRNK